MGERRLITVMFCDLVESTPLSQRLDPEDLAQVIRSLQTMVGPHVERFGGSIAQYLGDGVLAYFGHPRAHEDDAPRALHAALAIVNDLPVLNDRLGSLVPEGISVRIGVQTGPVVVEEMGTGVRREQLALGDTVNVAARLLKVAEPDCIVIGEETASLCAPLFDLEPLGEKALRGVKQLVAAFRVLGSRERAASPPRLIPMIGREEEIEELKAIWGEVLRGNGHTVLIGGEAGIGKSRLVEGFSDCLADDEAARIAWHCSRYHGQTAFHPVIVGLSRLLELDPQDPPEANAAKLRGALQEAGMDSERSFAALANLLGIPLPEAPSESAEARRRLSLEALAAWLRSQARTRPVVLLVEDLHLADASTVELLGRLIEAITDARVLLLLTFRPGFEPPWKGDPVRSLDLTPLGRSAAARMVDALARGHEMPSAVREQLVDRTDGIPLFVEELTRAVLESDWLESTGHALRIPTTIQGSLMARLDNLGSAKALAQRASVLGREFSEALLAAVSELARPALEHGLRQLVDSGLVLRVGDARDRAYVFKHALVQETAYGSQLREARVEAHARVGAVLEERFPHRVAAEPEMVARHYEAANAHERAIAYYQRAGEQAIRRSAHDEAMSHLDRAMALIPQVAEPLERARRELGLLIAIGAPLAAIKGYGHPDVERTQNRAYELCRYVAEGPPLYQAIGGQFLFYGSRAEMGRAEALALKLIELGERADDLFVQRMGQGFTGLIRFYQGRHVEAWGHLEHMLALEAISNETPEWYIHDPEPDVIARFAGGIVLAIQDRPREATELAEAAVARGRDSGNPFNLAFALAYAGLAAHCCGNAGRVLRLAEEGVKVCSDQGFPLYLSVSEVLRGWAESQLGAPAVGLAHIQEGLALGARAGALIEGPRVLGLLAEALAAAGEPAGALQAALRGVRLAERHGNVFWNPELLRMAADLRLALDPAAREDATRDLEQALALSGSHGARRLETRILHTLRAHRIEFV